MSKEIKLLLKDARQAFKEKQFKIAEEKCHVSILGRIFFYYFPKHKQIHVKSDDVNTIFFKDILKDDPKNHAAYLILGAIFQEANPSKVKKNKFSLYSENSTIDLVSSS